MKYGNMDVRWLGHASLLIKINDKIIFIDPYQLPPLDEKADIILITHSHYDHCSQKDIEAISKNGTIIFCTPDCQSTLARIEKDLEIRLVEPNQEISINGIKIKTIEAYNVNKKFHPKSEGWVGYIISYKDYSLYHAGDTDCIREMEKLTGYKNLVAFLPVGGTYTMTAEEAAKAASLIKPKLAIPMHYGTIIGSIDDAQKFVNLCKEKEIEAKIIEKG